MHVLGILGFILRQKSLWEIQTVRNKKQKARLIIYLFIYLAAGIDRGLRLSLLIVL